MALTQCGDCGGKLSTEATACPHCGRPTAKAVTSGTIAEPAKKSSGVGIGCLSILGLLFFFVCVSTLSRPPSKTGTTSSTTSSPRVAPPPPLAPAVQLRVEKWSWHEEYDYAIAEGQVTNVSDEPLKNVTAVVTFKTKSDEFITSDDGIIDYNPILPGQTSPWKVMARWNPAMSKAYVEFKTLFGGTLRAEQR